MTGEDTAHDGAGWRHPYGSDKRFHLQHVHLFASDIEASIAFYKTWFGAEVIWDGGYAGARNVFIKIGIGALHLYDQPPRDTGRNAVHHLGMQVVGIDDIYARMKAAGLSIPNPVRRSDSGDGGYFLLGGPDGVLIEMFEVGASRDEVVQRYYGFGGAAP